MHHVPPSLLTTHVCPVRSPVCRRGPPRDRPGNGPVCPSPMARSSDRPRQHPHNHDRTGQCQQVHTPVSIPSRDFLPAIRYALKQLQDRCISFLVVVQQKGDGAPPSEQQRLTAGVQRSLLHTPTSPVCSDDNLPAHSAASSPVWTSGARKVHSSFSSSKPIWRPRSKTVTWKSTTV